MLFIVHADIVNWCQSYHETGCLVPQQEVTGGLGPMLTDQLQVVLDGDTARYAYLEIVDRSRRKEGSGCNREH